MNELSTAGAPVAVNIENYKGEPITVIYRDGKVPEIQEPIKVVLVGNIYAVREYIEKNYKSLPAELQQGILVLSNVDKMGVLPAIEFDSAPAWPKQGTKVKAELKANGDVDDFHFNDPDSGRSPKQMIQFLRSHAHCFESIEEVRTLIKALQNQEVKFEHISSEEDDRKGSKESKIKEQIKITKGELPATLNIKMPYFEGTPAESITAEIEIDRKGTVPVFSFYCLGLEAAITASATKIVKQQIEGFISDIFVVIYK